MSARPEDEALMRAVMEVWCNPGPTSDADVFRAALHAAGLVILPAEMTDAQAARSLAGSGLAQRLRVSNPETYAEMVERRRATWRELVAVMGESGDE